MSKPYLVSMTIFGQLPSMKNQRRIVTNRRTGRPFSIKSKDAIAYADHFLFQIPDKSRLRYTGPVSLRVRVWYQSRRSDLDIGYLMDLIQKAEIILNDRQIIHIDAWKGLSRDNPRVIFSLYPSEDGPESREDAPGSDICGQ